MLRHRVIPCLLVKNGGLVKTRRFEDPKYVGDPINAIRIFNDKEVDELMVLDILASREGREPDYDMIELYAGECFMPLCYGGGIRDVAQAQRLFALGVEKVSIQTGAMRRPELVDELAREVGSQSVVLSVDVKRDWRGRAKLYFAATRERADRPWLEYAREMVERGAGEIVINSVDRDGVMNGYDLELVREAASALSVPVIAMGGAGTLEHIKEAARAGASALAAGSLFVFQGPHRAVLISYPRYSELEGMFSELSLTHAAQ